MTKAQLFLLSIILTLAISCGENDPFTSEFQMAPDQNEIDTNNDEAQIDLPDIELLGEPELNKLSDINLPDSQSSGDGCNKSGNIIRNPSFENLDSRKGLLKNESLLSFDNDRTWDLFNALPGTNSKEQDSWFLVQGAGVEVQSNSVVVESPSGNLAIELDSHGKNSNSAIKQNIQLCKGIYDVSFIYYARSPIEGDNIINLEINDFLITNLDLKKSNMWTHILQKIKVNKEGPYDLILSAGGKANTIGALVDAVDLRKN